MATSRKDILGLRFGKWIVVEELTERSSSGAILWRCRCDCGSERKIQSSSLRSGGSSSCNSCSKIKHGESIPGRSSPEYEAWTGMKCRCSATAPKADYYFKRGIKVCKRWSRSFESFLKDVGRKPHPKYLLDRIDNDKGYQPGNVRWVSIEESNRNRRVCRKGIKGAS